MQKIAVKCNSQETPAKVLGEFGCILFPDIAFKIARLYREFKTVLQVEISTDQIGFGIVISSDGSR